MKGKIVTIGGGNLGTLKTLAIDREIVRLTRKKHPHALFIPTASSDDEGYWKIFQEIYGKVLKCKTDVLYLIKQISSYSEIQNKISQADLIYVGGGNTLKMMRKWKRLRIDKLLRYALKKGTVLCGLSAGCICWYTYGHSDSIAYYNPKKWKYIRVRGMNFIQAIGCPHYNGEKRDKNFQKMIKKYNLLGLAIDDCCALEFIHNSYRVITSQKNAGAYKVYAKEGNLITEKIKQTNHFLPLSSLLTY